MSHKVGLEQRSIFHEVQQNLYVGRQVFLRGYLLLCCWIVSCSTIVMQISAWGGEMSKLAVEYFFVHSLLYFHEHCQCLLTPSLLCIHKRMKSCQCCPNSGASICNWIKHLHSLPISLFEIAFPKGLLMHIWFKGKLPGVFFRSIMNLSSEDKISDTRVHTYACTGLQVLFFQVLTIVSFWGTCSRCETNSEQEALFVSHWSGSMGFRLFYFVLSF